MPKHLYQTHLANMVNSSEITVVIINPTGIKTLYREKKNQWGIRDNVRNRN